MKIWLRCNAKDGYCHQASVYLGKQGTDTPGRNGLYFSIVDQLTKSLRGKNYRIFFDNLYCSIPLVKFLYSKSLLSAGTIRAHRRLIPNLCRNPGRLERGQFKTFQDSDLTNLTCTVWRDTKDVRFASTMSNPELVTQAVRRVQARHIQVQMPHVAHQYGKNYSGVDRFDNLRSKKYGCLSRPSKKTWKHLLWFLVNASLVNAWILYQQSSTRPTTKKNFSHFDFRHSVAVGLINGFSSRMRKFSRPAQFNGAPTNSDNLSSHMNTHMGPKRPKRCYYHKFLKPDGKARRETVRGCKICDIYLCPQCFLAWHSRNNNAINQ